MRSRSTAEFSGSGNTYTPSYQSACGLRKRWVTFARATCPVTRISTSVSSRGAGCGGPSPRAFNSRPWAAGSVAKASPENKANSEATIKRNVRAVFMAPIAARRSGALAPGRCKSRERFWQSGEAKVRSAREAGRRRVLQPVEELRFFAGARHPVRLTATSGCSGCSGCSSCPNCRWSCPSPCCRCWSPRRSCSARGSSSATCWSCCRRSPRRCCRWRRSSTC